MKTRFLLSSLLAIVLCSLVPAKLLASTEGAESALKASVDQVLTIDKKVTDRETLIREVKPVLEKILDFSIMTRRAVGPGWKQFTPDEQKEATQLFSTLILRTYTAKFTPGEYPEITYKTSSETAPGRVEIPTTSVYKGSRYDVIYRLENKTSTWMITDIVIEGVSLVANYRTQFDGEFRKGGSAAVLSALKQAVSQSK